MGISIIQNPVPIALVDAKGDIFVATADNTIGRLPIGANNTVLTADSSEQGGMKWATAGGDEGNTQIASLFIYS